MKKLILSILFIVGCVFSQDIPPQYDIKNMTSAEKMIAFDMNRKSPTIGVMFSLLPSAGHAYARNWKRGLLFFGGEVTTFSLALTFNDKAWGEGDERYQIVDEGYKSLSEKFYIISLIIFIWDKMDAGQEVVKYNNRLYKLLYGRNPPSFSLNLEPTYQGANLTMSYAIN